MAGGGGAPERGRHRFGDDFPGGTRLRLDRWSCRCGRLAVSRRKCRSAFPHRRIESRRRVPRRISRGGARARRHGGLPLLPRIHGGPRAPCAGSLSGGARPDRVHFLDPRPRRLAPMAPCRHPALFGFAADARPLHLDRRRFARRLPPAGRGRLLRRGRAERESLSVRPVRPPAVDPRRRCRVGDPGPPERIRGWAGSDARDLSGLCRPRGAAALPCRRRAHRRAYDVHRDVRAKKPQAGPDRAGLHHGRRAGRASRHARTPRSRAIVAVFPCCRARSHAARPAVDGAAVARPHRRALPGSGSVGAEGTGELLRQPVAMGRPGHQSHDRRSPRQRPRPDAHPVQREDLRRSAALPRRQSRHLGFRPSGREFGRSRDDLRFGPDRADRGQNPDA